MIGCGSDGAGVAVGSDDGELCNTTCNGPCGLCAVFAVAAVLSLVDAVFWLSAPTEGVFPKKCPTMSKNKPPTVPAGNNLKYSRPPAMMSKARYAAYCATCGMVIVMIVFLHE